MIIDFDRRCNKNHEITREEFILLVFDCPNCNAKQMEYHSTYGRWAITLETDGVGSLKLTSSRITITRGQCLSCEKTHAILPGDIIPYKQYSLNAIIAILKYVLEDKITVANVANMLGISHQVIYEIIGQWSIVLIRVSLLLRDTFQIHNIPDPHDSLFLIRFIANNPDRAPPAYLRYFKWPMFMAENQKAIPQKASIGISE